MSIEETVRSAMEHGQRSALFEEVSNIRRLFPNKNLELVYEEAYERVMKI
jgi:hypothetical protein